MYSVPFATFNADMPNQTVPFYDPLKSYEENFLEGPFGAFADGEVLTAAGEPTYSFMGLSVHTPFGIAAGPLINGKFVKAALDKGFDIVTYKTVRTKKYPCHPWPNVLPVEVGEPTGPDSFKEPLKVKTNYESPLSITNSFGVPSYDPDFWQKDMTDAVEHAREGQIVIGSFQGTKWTPGNVEAYIQDFVTAAKLMQETGVPILEVNFSCPNEGTNQLLCYDIQRSALIAEKIKNKIGNTPLIIKIGYFEDMITLEKFVQAVGKIADGLATVNTIPAEVQDKQGRQILPGEGRARSGICGQGTKWAGLEMVKRLKQLREKLGLSFQILGMGGVFDFQDYQAYREAGADAVQSATGAMWNPYMAQDIKKYIQ